MYKNKLLVSCINIEQDMSNSVCNICKLETSDVFLGNTVTVKLHNTVVKPDLTRLFLFEFTSFILMQHLADEPYLDTTLPKQ